MEFIESVSTGSSPISLRSIQAVVPCLLYVWEMAAISSILSNQGMTSLSSPAPSSVTSFNFNVVDSVSAPLSVATTYSGVIELFNETVSPAEPVHEEVAEESAEHQFFYTQGGNINVTTNYEDFDGNGNPLGLSFSLSTTSAGQGTMTFTLRHEPLKPNDGTLSGAGGETDLSVTFPITIE